MSPPMRTQAAGECTAAECSSTSGISPSADRGGGGEDDRQEACLAGFVDRFVEAAAFAAEEVGVVDEQDGVLDFDAGQR